MYRKYPKKEGRTFKYHGYTDRIFRLWFKKERYLKRNERKGNARILVHQMKYVDEEQLEILEAKLLSLESPKNFIGYLD